MTDCDCGAIVPGVLAPMDTDDGIQRCDECQVYPGDLEAAAALAAHVGGTVHFLAFHGDDVDVVAPVAWDGNDLPEGQYIADRTNPWVEIDGHAVDWTDYLKEH